MTFDLTLPMVMLAAFGLVNLPLSAAVALWSRSGSRLPVRADAVLGIRLLPATASAAFALTVVLPAFLLHEPRHAHDEPGPLLILSALFALAVFVDGARRGLKAWWRTRALTRGARPYAGPAEMGSSEVSVIDVNAPLVAVVGGWRQRIVATSSVAAVCDREEFRQVLAHETAHQNAGDNLKLLLLVSAPDALAWLPAGRDLTEHWRAVAELEADERASGSDPHKRVALASALIKVARLSMTQEPARPRAQASVARSGLEARVRRLIAPSRALPDGPPRLGLLAGALLLPLLAMPLYVPIHRLIEVLVAFGR